MVRYWRKVIRVRAEDSPNVRLGMAEKKAGHPITDRILVPGVVTYLDYLKRRSTWDPIMQCIGLDGEFYQGQDIMLFPPQWLNLAEEYALTLSLQGRSAEAIGVDSAEGGDNTAIAAIDRFGLLELVSVKTPDTSVINDIILGLMRKWHLPQEKADRVLLDAGGGGYEHANQLRRKGFNVRAIRFGAAVTTEIRSGMTLVKERKDQVEEKYTYKDVRTEMYAMFSQRLNPDNKTPFGLPANLLNRPREDGGSNLRRQLTVIPKWYDENGRQYLPPKRLKSDAGESNRQSLEKMLGCSPDEADALVLANYGLMKPVLPRRAGLVG